MFIEVDEKYVKARVIAQTAEVLRKGGIIIYPTDTVYAYACDIRCKNAIEKIYSIKKIDRKKPLSFVFSDISMMSSYVKNMPDYAFKVMRKVLPGPYTFIFNASKLLPDIVLTKQKTIGVRIPDSVYALEIVKELGVPFLSAGLDLDEGEYETDPRNLPK
ncbi:MAG: threonylcarbamoyl-AMP synthase, partial [Spirochaetes bacterium]|nr:threonylcarbamoyl-AMP synthase [Spirochaetota bacterium]